MEAKKTYTLMLWNLENTIVWKSVTKSIVFGDVASEQLEINKILSFASDLNPSDYDCNLSKATFAVLICLSFDIACLVRIMVLKLSASAKTFITSIISSQMCSATNFNRVLWNLCKELSDGLVRFIAFDITGYIVEIVAR